MYLYELAPGRGASRYHYEYEEEWVLVRKAKKVGRTPVSHMRSDDSKEGT
jgi:hypothetical protein